MRFMLLVTLTALLVLFTLLPLTRRPAWWVRAAIFPRLQIMIAAVLLLAAQVALLDTSSPASRVLILVTLACMLYQGWWIYPYTRLRHKEVRTYSGPRSASRIRILASNVLGPNRNAGALIDMIRQHDPDLFVTLESNAWWQQQLDELEDMYPHSMKCPLENLYGMHVYSKLPLEDKATQFLVQKQIPSMHANVVLESGRRVHVHFLHPAPPSPTENESSVPRDSELLVVARSIAQRDEPTIVAGDLNDVAWSGTTRLFRKISRLLDPRVGRGMFNTYHAGHWWVRWPLDHLFHSDHFMLAFMKRLPSIGSDHFPVLVELVFDEKHGEQQEGLEVDGDDHARAQRLIGQKDVSAGDVHKPGE